MIPTEISISPPGSAITWGCHHQGSCLGRGCAKLVGTRGRRVLPRYPNSQDQQLAIVNLSNGNFQVGSSSMTELLQHKKLLFSSKVWVNFGFLWLCFGWNLRSKKLLHCLQWHYSRTMPSSCRLTSRASQKRHPPAPRHSVFDVFSGSHLFITRFWTGLKLFHQLSSIAFMSHHFWQKIFSGAQDALAE